MLDEVPGERREEKKRMTNAVNKEYKRGAATYVIHFSSGKKINFHLECEFLDADEFLDNLLDYDWNKDVYFLKDIYISEYDPSSVLINLKNVEFIERID